MVRSFEQLQVEKPGPVAPPPRPIAPLVAAAVFMPSSSPSCSSSARPPRLHHPVRLIRNTTRNRACLELFSGCESLTLTLRSAGLSCFEGVELKKSSHFDLCRPDLQVLILQLIREGHLYYVHLGTPCTIWSRARRGIRNWARAEEKERIGLQLALFSARVIECCEQNDVYWSLENPHSSKLFQFAPIARWLALRHAHEVVWDMCRFGGRYQKRTRLVTTLPALRT